MRLEAGPAPKPRRRGFAIAGLVVALILVVVMIDGVWDRKSSAARLKVDTDAQIIPTVSVIQPKAASRNPHLDLPGRLDAYYRAPIFARVNGFLKAWYVDIGGRVKAGQLLAEIEAPDLDQQLMQAKGALSSATAAETLAKVTAERWTTLGQTNTLSKQAVDEKTGDLSVKEANVKVAKADVDRLDVLANFKKVVAPFDGVVTARNTDVGSLINAGANAGLPLFVVSDVSKLRLSINVPQAYVPSVPISSKVDIKVPEHPGKTYSGVVEASTRAVDEASGTTRMQVVVDNPSGELMPGAYANALVTLPREMQVLSIPSSALIFDKRGLQVAVVDADNKVELRPVKIAKDKGQTIELSSGVTATDRVIESPPDGLADGDMVHLVSANAAPMSAAKH